jgi:hypothetical protein
VAHWRKSGAWNRVPQRLLQDGNNGAVTPVREANLKRTKGELDIYVKYNYLVLYGVSGDYGIHPGF